MSWLNEHLFSHPAAIYGLSKLGHSNTISGLRRILRRFDMIDAYERPVALNGRWGLLLQALQGQKFCEMALTRFAGWCQEQGIVPDAVCRQTLVDYEDHVRRRQLRADITGLVRGVAKAWRKSARTLDDWPRSPILSVSKRQNYTLPFTAFPETFQRDVESFSKHLSAEQRDGPFRGDGPRRSLRPSSIRSRLYSLRQAASMLVLLGRDVATVTSLADLVTEPAFKAILTEAWERAISSRNARGELSDPENPSRESGVTAQTGGIASALMMIAKYHCKLDMIAVDRLRLLAADVSPSKQTELSQKNRDRLRQFDDPLTLAKLLHLPEALMQAAEAMEQSRPFEAARKARVAVAINLLCNIPLRVSNLARLKLGEHLKYSDTRSGRISHLSLQSHETKNRRSVEWEIGRDLDSFLRRYTMSFRHILSSANNDSLFPAGFGNPGPLSIEAMAWDIKQTIAEEIGVIMNPHLFRALAAKLILEENPGALEDVRQLLGDKTLAIVLAHYAAIQPVMAARRYSALISKARTRSPYIQ